MTLEIGLTLGIIVMALVLFATEKFRVDLIALIVLLVVSITGLVSKEEVFSGFANPAVITIWAVYIVSGGLFKTGVADTLGSLILRLSGTGEARLIAVIMLVFVPTILLHRDCSHEQTPRLFLFVFGRLVQRVSFLVFARFFSALCVLCIFPCCVFLCLISFCERIASSNQASGQRRSVRNMFSCNASIRKSCAVCCAGAFALLMFRVGPIW